MKNTLKITKELFIETINTIEQQHNHDRKCSDAFKIILPNDYISSYDNSLVVNQLVRFLQIAMNDNHKDSWIDYFLYELDYGKKYKFGDATNKDGSNIDLSNAETLYEFLTINN